MSTNRVEDRSSYKVLYNHRNFEVRMYTPIALSEVNNNAFKFKEYSRTGIKNLAKFGLPNNKTIPTSYSARYTNLLVNQNKQGSSIPKQINQEENSEKLYVAVITFNGFAFESDIKANAKKMVMALKEENISHFGNFQFVGYNSIFQFFKRRNDVIVSINYKK
jgi:hypothetical protein